MPSCILHGPAVYCKCLGKQKNAMIHSNRPLVFAPMICLFLLCILIRIVYFKKIITNDKPIYAVKTDFVSRVYITCIRTELHDQNKNTVGAKTRSLWE